VSIRTQRPLIVTLIATLATLAVVGFALLGARPAQAAPAIPSTSAAAGPWSDTLAEYGMPSTPQQWQPSNWDIQTHIRSQNTSGDFIDSHLADHGADCGAPPAQHSINTWQQVVFVCHSHVMTAMADSGYGETVLTPDRMADWSGGAVTIGWSVSTQRTTSRDWIAIDVTPFANQFALPFDEGSVDLAGMPKDYLELRANLEDYNGVQTRWSLDRPATGNDFGTEQDSEWPYFEELTGIPMSATVRTPLQFTFDKTSYTFRVGPTSAISPGKVIFSGKWSKPLAFTSGVVQFVHHSYNPGKCDVVAISCKADTWHWSDFNISNAVQYTMLKPTDHQVVTGSGGVVSFGSPAPSGSYLKFAGIGSVQVSYDGGKTYAAAVKAPLDGYGGADEHFNSFLSPVPPGVSQVQFKLAGGWYGPGMVRDLSLISQTLGGVSPSPTPTNTPTPPTPTPSPTATPVATSTPSATPTPIPLQHVPCTVAIGDVIRDGYCDGTFTPNP
jgi:hypothetical protein